MRSTPVILGIALTLAASPSLAQPTDPSGIDFVTITDPGNAPWTGGGFNNNRGQVNHEYRIGRFEVTTSQWAEFMNAALDRPSTDRIPHVFAPGTWGAVSTTPTNPGARRYTVPTGREMIPTGGVDWRTCAIYCNWLHNGKSSDRSAFLSGAYDVGTFGYIGEGGGYTDQLTRSPGARYFIPSTDEWMKAAHWNPNRNGPGQGGWMLYSNNSDNPFVYGPPGVLVNGQPATANSNWTDLTRPGFDPFSVPLGAYTGVTSPWGLYDVAGATAEWTEGTFWFPGEPVPRDRLLEGSAWSSDPSTADLVRSSGGGWFPTYFGNDVGFRIAAVIPAPATYIAMTPLCLASLRRSRPR